MGDKNALTFKGTRSILWNSILYLVVFDAPLLIQPLFNPYKFNYRIIKIVDIEGISKGFLKCRLKNSAMYWKMYELLQFANDM